MILYLLYLCPNYKWHIVMDPSVSTAVHFTFLFFAAAYPNLHFAQVPMSIVLLCKRGRNRALICGTHRCKGKTYIIITYIHFNIHIYMRVFYNYTYLHGSILLVNINIEASVYLSVKSKPI